MYTSILDSKISKSLPENIFPSLFQEFVEKEFEVKTFVFGNMIWSMAFFSTSDKDKVDYRKENQTLNRRIPFKLPNEIERKILKLMRNLNLTVGTVDLIKSKNKKYYFLEINPVGQFNMVSMPCNYYIEKEIALNLINDGKH